MTRRIPAMTLYVLLLAALVAAAATFARGTVAGLLTGLLALGIAGLVAWLRRRGSEADEEHPKDPSRRRLLALTGAAGVALVVAGTGIGRIAKRLTRPDPEPVIRGMAQDLGSDYLELVRRGYHAPTSGDLQLLLSPGNSSNYPQESTTLIVNDPRTSHASVWNYLEQVPLAVHAPGLVEPGTSDERVSLADIAPTIAALIGFDGFRAHDGTVLPGIGPAGKTPDVVIPGAPPEKRAPRVVVTLVVDGGGWNVLGHWKDSWPNQRELFSRSMLYRNAIHGSFPAVTASAHATIGTGAFPQTHGISGHNLRVGGGHVRKAYGLLGHAMPSDIQIPTLADLWDEHTGGKAFIGEFGYQIWHLGMIGRGGNRPLGDKPVAAYWDEPNFRWASQNPELYRLPKVVPPDTQWRQAYEAYMAENPDDFPPNQHGFSRQQTPACVPATVAYQGDLIEAAFDSEDIGNHDATDLVFINFKFPDYTGHIYNMLEPPEGVMLAAVDEQIGRIAAMLEERFPGEYVLILTADHGQCPLPDAVEGVRLDPIQIAADIEAEFGGGSVFPIVHEVAPSEIFLDGRGLADAAVDPADVAAWLKDYRYRENFHLYQGVPRDAIEWNLLQHKLFSAVLPDGFIQDLQGADSLAHYGAGNIDEGSPPPPAPAEPGSPPQRPPI